MIVLYSFVRDMTAQKEEMFITRTTTQYPSNFEKDILPRICQLVLHYCQEIFRINIDTRNTIRVQGRLFSWRRLEFSFRTNGTSNLPTRVGIQKSDCCNSPSSLLSIRFYARCLSKLLDFQMPAARRYPFLHDICSTYAIQIILLNKQSITCSSTSSICIRDRVQKVYGLRVRFLSLCRWSSFGDTYFPHCNSGPPLSIVKTAISIPFRY